MNPIDVVITWVDGSDFEWIAEKQNYQPEDKRKDVGSEALRFRDWDNLQYIFRGIEKFMPWVNKVHFVTWGHLPKWLNIECPKLNIVRHTDYIPAAYLPTFNSNCIELNMHRIPGLAEQFINFNDDMFVIRNTLPEDFFVNGKPRDMACISPQPVQRSSIAHIEFNNLQILNDYFSIEDIHKNKAKWLNFRLYGQYAARTAIFMRFKTIIGIFEPHIPFSHLKSTYDLLWEKEFDCLDKTSHNQFRSAEDVNEWLIRSWQLLSGQFEPRSRKFGIYISAEDIDGIRQILKGNKYKLVCINDNESVIDFEKTKNLVNKELEKLLPNKSDFEK